MARITDAERGARLALDIAVLARMQPDMFDGGLPDAFWHGIEMAAHDQLDECIALRAVLS